MTAENITTVGQLPDADSLSGEEYLYVIQGASSDRDRKVSVQTLLESNPDKGKVLAASYDRELEYLIDKLKRLPTSSAMKRDLEFYGFLDSSNKYGIRATLLNRSVTNEKIALGAIGIEHLEDNFKPITLNLYNSKGENIDGKGISYEWENLENPTWLNIGNIGEVTTGRIVDFTLSFKFGLNQQNFTTFQDYEIEIWSGTPANKISYDIKVGLVTGHSIVNKGIVTERFSFKTTNSAQIKISFKVTSKTITQFKLENFRLRGFAF